MDKWLKGNSCSISGSEEDSHSHNSTSDVEDVNITLTNVPISSESEIDSEVEDVNLGEIEKRRQSEQSCSKSLKKSQILKSNFRKYKFCRTWVDLPETKGWLSKSDSLDRKGNELAFCKVCKHNIVAHKSTIKKHATSEKHKYNFKSVNSNVKLTDMMKSCDLEKNVKIAEMKLCGLLTTNNLPFLLMDTLSPLLKNIFPDSKIATHLSIKRTKATAVINECGNIFLENLYKKLKKSGCFFSLILDETTDISVTKQCAYSVIYFDDEENGVINRFFDINEAKGGRADDIFDSLIMTLQSRNIPLSNMIGFASDTPNVMVGEYHSVFSLLKKDNPNMVCIKCSCHMVHLAASRACLKLPRSVEDLLRNLGSHFNRSSARQQKFKEFQIFFQTDIHKILSPAITRWLSLKACVDRVLEQYEPLRAYLRETLFEDPSITTENMLSTMENPFTKVYLEFMSYSLSLLTDFNLLFQSEKPLLHKVRPETENLLKTLCSNFMNISAIRNKNIFTINHKCPHNFVQLHKIYLGVQATESLEEIKKKANNLEKDIEKFLKTILEFYLELVSNIKERFRFDDKIYDILTIVDPLNAQSFEIKSLKNVIDRFPILNEHINNIQEIDDEWRRHALLDHTILNVDPTDSNYVEKYWCAVFNLKNGAGNPIFPNLRKIFTLLLILPFSNASVERIFSNLFNIKTDKRNLLNTSTIRAILATKEGIQHSGGCVKFLPDNNMLNAKIWHKK